MPVSFNCSCGERLEVDDELAGQRARCPYCEAVVDVPAARTPPTAKRAKLAEPDESDDDRGGFSGSLNPLDRSNRPSSRRPRDDEDDSPPRRRSYGDEDEEDDRPRRRRRFEPPPYNFFNKQTVGGAVAFFIGIVLFAVGLYFEVVCLRLVIILVIGGLIGMIRGIITGRDG